MAPILQLFGIGKRYGDLVAVDNVTLSIAENQYVSLLGPSGSGKTTLLRLIAGFERPDSGHLAIGGQPIDGVPAHRRGIGFVFQNFALFQHLTVEQNVAFGLANREAGPALDGGAIARRVRDMLALVGLTGLEGRSVHQISGGQRQRVALARTLVTEPRLVLLDEPLGALDANLRTRMRSELRAIRERLGVTFLHVTGSESEALAMGDTVIVLDSGRIGQIADAGTIYDRPASPRVARFLNCYNLFEGALRDNAFATAVGRFPLAGPLRLPSDSGNQAPSQAYAIRYDRIDVRPADATPAANEVRVEGAYVAGEYTGASVLSFFALDDGRVVEIEAHLSHRAPPSYTEGQRYGLIWKSDDALLFA
ncbi:MAG: ABC transporter ATP-binding protein [Kiloniellales bacterium]